MRSYIVKEHHIDSAVSEILRYTQTNIHIDILLLLYKDFKLPLSNVHYSDDTQGGRGHMAVNYTGIKICITTFSYSLTQKFVSFIAF